MATTPCAAPAERRTATTFPGAFAYEQTDIPPGMTIDEYRRERGAHRRGERERRRTERRRALMRPIAAVPELVHLPQRRGDPAMSDSTGNGRLRGDEDALFCRHRERLIRAVRRVVHASDALIEDACAIAWLQLVRTQPERGPRLFGWLRTVAVHEAYRLSMAERRETPLEALCGSSNGGGAQPDDWEALIEGPWDLERHLDAKRALEVMAALPSKERLYLALFAAGFRYEEIVRLCGATYTNVNKHLTRARLGRAV